MQEKVQSLEDCRKALNLMQVKTDVWLKNGGQHTPDITIEVAWDIICDYKEIIPTLTIYPTYDGGVCLDFEHDELLYEISIDTKGEVRLVIDEGDSYDERFASDSDTQFVNQEFSDALELWLSGGVV